MIALGQMLLEDGVEEGIGRDVQQGLGRADVLIVELADVGRADDIIWAVLDKTYQEQSFKEFEIW